MPDERLSLNGQVGESSIERSPSYSFTVLSPTLATGT